MLNKILIVDDEPDIIEFLKYNLEKAGYIIESALNGEACLKKLATFTPQLIILDVMMPKMNGIDTCESIKNNPKLQDVFILFLSARNEDFTQISCYDAGGDDFISKPIHPKLLIKKINTFFKRINSKKHPIVNGIEIDLEKHKVVCDGQVLKLPKKQFALLSLLYSKPDKVFTRDEIINRVWGTDYFISARNIDVQIRKIREQIGDDKIETIKGVGYRLVVH